LATNGEKTEDTNTCFDKMYKRDRRTDGRTLHDGMGRAYA